MRDFARAAKKISIPEPAVEPHFYKYSSPAHLEWVRTIILEHKLYVPTLPELNDPRDGRPKVANLTEREFVRFLHNKFVERNPQMSAVQRQRHRENISALVRARGPAWLQRELVRILYRDLAGFRVYSMTKRHDNLSLWAKYGGDHSGYCLEFANIGGLFSNSRPVSYGDTVEMDVNNPGHLNGYWFFWKRTEWSNEEEIRLVGSRRQEATVTIDPSWLTRIILGYRMAASDEKQIRSWACERAPKVTVVRARYDEVGQRILINQ